MQYRVETHRLGYDYSLLQVVVNDLFNCLKNDDQSYRGIHKQRALEKRKEKKRERFVVILFVLCFVSFFLITAGALPHHIIILEEEECRVLHMFYYIKDLDTLVATEVSSITLETRDHRGSTGPKTQVGLLLY